MKAIELRSGSIISINGNIVVVDHIRCHDYSVTIKDGFDIAFNGGNLLTDNDDDVKPIPLTPSVLEAAGFENDKGEFLMNGLNIDLIFSESDNKGIWCAYNVGYDKRGSSDVGINYPILLPICEPFKYFHQLQNLYFALTGTELDIDIEKLKP